MRTEEGLAHLKCQRRLACARSHKHHSTRQHRRLGKREDGGSLPLWAGAHARVGKRWGERLAWLRRRLSEGPI